MQRHALYSQLAEYYDKFYWSKDYGREVDFLVGVFDRYGAKVHDILEVACGTGNHTKLLAAKGYHVTGVDISEDVLRVARRKLGRRANFVQGDMRDLNAVLPGETYDAVVCLFSSISYNRTSSDLKKTLRGMYDHTRPGGVVAFDTPFTKQGFVDGYRGEDIFDDGRMMGARLGVSTRKEDSGEIAFSYLIKDGPETIVLRNDVHRLGLFSKGDFQLQMREVGFTKLRVFTDWDLHGKAKPVLFSDTIFVGIRPQA
jgi:dTDP-3-amino-3,4,6-trideoxy-alpha-D-glucopyranose N,N-dimethyltransferase